MNTMKKIIIIFVHTTQSFFSKCMCYHTLIFVTYINICIYTETQLLPTCWAMFIPVPQNKIKCKYIICRNINVARQYHLFNTNRIWFECY